MIMESPFIVQNIMFNLLFQGLPAYYIYLFTLCPWSMQWTVTIVVKDGDKRKDCPNKYCDNGNEESDVEVEGGETRKMGGTSGGYKWS